MKKVLSFLGAAVAVALCLTSCSKKSENGMFLKEGKFVVGTNAEYPPFEYLSSDGKTLAGFDIDLAKALSEKLNVEVEIVDVAWEGIFAGLDTKKYDAVISGITITPEREEAYGLSNAYVGNAQAIILNKNSNLSVSKPEDLEGLTVGYLTESASDIFMTKRAEAGMKFAATEYDNVLNAFEDLKIGRCDAVVSDSIVATDYVLQKDSPFVTVWQGEAEEFIAIAFNKSNVALKDAVNNALAELKADGTLKALSEKNFGSDIVSNVQ